MSLWAALGSQTITERGRLAEKNLDVVTSPGKCLGWWVMLTEVDSLGSRLIQHLSKRESETMLLGAKKFFRDGCPF